MTQSSIRSSSSSAVSVSAAQSESARPGNVAVLVMNFCRSATTYALEGITIDTPGANYISGDVLTVSGGTSTVAATWQTHPQICIIQWPSRLGHFEADYPTGAPADAAGRLTHDIDGRPLSVSARIVGRQDVGG